MPFDTNVNVEASKLHPVCYKISTYFEWHCKLNGSLVNKIA